MSVHWVDPVVTGPVLVTTNDTDTLAPASTVAGAVTLPTTRSGRGFTVTSTGLAETVRLLPSPLPSYTALFTSVTTMNS